MNIEINVPGATAVDEVVIQTSLQTLANNLTKSNIQFIAELSRKKGINEKLEKNKNKLKLLI